MTKFVKIAKVQDIAPGERLWHDFDEESVIVFNVGGQFYCIADLCSHDDGPLEDGELEGYEVACPRHGARFDIRNGKVLCLPATSNIPTYQVKVEGDDIYLELPNGR